MTVYSPAACITMAYGTSAYTPRGYNTTSYNSTLTWFTVIRLITPRYDGLLTAYGTTATTQTRPPLRSTVVRASAPGAGGRGSIADRVTPKTQKLGGLRFSGWPLALMC